MDFSTLFINFKCDSKDKMYSIFQRIKPLIIIDFLILNRNSPAGRPIKIDFDLLLDAFESGSQFKYVKHYGISKTTFYRYLKILSDNQIVEQIYYQMIQFQDQNSIIECPRITDTMSVKSMRGSVGLGRNPTDRGRKALKISLICDLDRVTKCVHIGACNIHDSQMLIRTLDNIRSPLSMVDCLCDSGYVGKNLKKYCEKKNHNLIVKPRRTRNKSLMTHTLSELDMGHLNKFRNRIELLNQNIRRYRSLWVQNVSIYKCFLFIVLLCISSYQMLTTK